ncbi:hypothetical protein [Pontibacter mucosus]|uniref:hypothetical protein n=1 Tax=Pontibacter mucosus TaxID=1649266 RepID=UPI000D3359A6|nr:hypothetical protein [Pontibacter mucosus]
MINNDSGPVITFDFRDFYDFILYGLLVYTYWWKHLPGYLVTAIVGVITNNQHFGGLTFAGENTQQGQLLNYSEISNSEYTATTYGAPTSIKSV